MGHVRVTCVHSRLNRLPGVAAYNSSAHYWKQQAKLQIDCQTDISCSCFEVNADNKSGPYYKGQCEFNEKSKL